MRNKENIGIAAEGWHAESDSGYVHIFYKNNDGASELNKRIPFSDIASRLDAGEWDKNLLLGMEVIHAWMSAAQAVSVQESLLLWRWLISAAFIREQREKHGTVIIEWENGVEVECAVYKGERGGMNIFPLTERLAMANNIEGALIERYGPDEGTLNAVRFYMAMRADDGGLSDMGREVLTQLHDDFIRQIQEEGLPGAPVVH